MAGPKSNLRFAGKHGYYKDDSSGLLFGPLGIVNQDSYWNMPLPNYKKKRK